MEKYKEFRKDPSREAATDHEIEDPLWPGEVQTPNRLYEMPLDERRVLGGRLLGHGARGRLADLPQALAPRDRGLRRFRRNGRQPTPS